MKRSLLLSILLVTMVTSLFAQTIRPGIVLNEDSCYLYAVDPLPFVSGILEDNGVPLQFLVAMEEPNLHGEMDLTARYPTRGGTTVYGIAVTSPDPLLGNIYLDLSLIHSGTMVNRLASASNGDPYIVAEYKYEAYTHDGQYVDYVSPSHEYYFDRPIHIVEDSFYAGIRVATNQAPYEEYRNYRMSCLEGGQTFYNITNIIDNYILTIDIGHLGNFFPIVKLPCPRQDKPYLGANVGGMALFTWDTAEGATYQIGISQGDDSSYSFVHLSDTLRGGRYTYTGSLPEGWYNAHLRRSCTYCFSGADTLAWSRWSEGRRFYYTPNPAAIDPSDLQPPTFDLYPTPTTGILNVEFRNVNFEGAATLQLLDLEGRLLQEFEIPNSKFENPNSKTQKPDSKIKIQNSKTQKSDSKFENPNSKFTIDITPLPAGTYLLRTAGATRRVVKK